MVETYTAIRFGGDATGGATIPSRMECIDDAGGRYDVYVKFSWQQCAPGGLVRELVGSLLAKALGLNAARPVLVDVPQELIEAIAIDNPDSALRMAGSVRPAFGSVSHGSGFLLFRPPSPANDGFSFDLAEMWAFDQLTLNPDRNNDKPNCLIKGEKLGLIDHEKALSLAFLGTLLLPPWDLRWTPYPHHLVHNEVVGGRLQLDRLQRAWRDLGQADIESICAQVPPVWDATVLTEIQGYLINLHDNIDLAFDNLRRVRP